MQDYERMKIQEAIEAIDICTNELQIQVLNNVDAQMEVTQSDEASKNAVRTFVKQPIIKAVKRLQSQKLNLMKLVQQLRSQS